MYDVIDLVAGSDAAGAFTAVMVPLAVKSALILGAAGIITHLLRSSAAALRHLVWLTAMVGVLLLPIIAVVLPAVDVPLPERASRFVAAHNDVSTVAATTEPDHAAGRSVLPGNRADGGTPNTADRPDRAEPAGTASTDARRARASVAAVPRSHDAVTPTDRPATGLAAVVANITRVHWTTWIALVWVAGTLILLFRLFFAHVAAWSLLRSSCVVHDDDWHLSLERHSNKLGVGRRVRLRECTWLDVPVTIGTARPTIVLPAEADRWDEQTRTAVLLHELAHVRRLDCLAQSVVEIVRAVFWVNPLAWIAESSMRVERERACDDLVIATGTRASTYAQTLLDLARSLRGVEPSSAAVMAMARRSDLEGRLLDILDNGPRLRTLNRIGAVLAVVVMLSVVLPVASLRPASAQDASDRTDSVPAADERWDRPIDREGVSAMPDIPSVPDLPDFSFSAPDIRVTVPDIEVPDRWTSDFDLSFEDEKEIEAFAERAREAAEQGRFSVMVDGLDELIGRLGRSFAYAEYRFDRAERPTFAPDTLTIDELLQLARHGVDAEYVEELRDAGYPDLSYESLMAFARHGIDADYVADLSAYGLGDLSTDEIVELARHGVDDVLVEYRELGLTNLSVEQIIDLSRHGVDPDDISRWRQNGFNGLSVDDYVNLSRYGVDDGLIGALTEVGYSDLTAEQITRLARHGVDEDLIFGLEAAGYGRLTIEQIEDFARHGIEADCLVEMNGTAYGQFSPDVLIRFARHGVDADFIHELADGGITGLSPDDIIKLHDHGITASFVKKMRGDDN